MNKFTKKFKEKAIRLKEQELHPNEIFQSEGIDITGKQKDYAGKLISDWRKDEQTQKKLNSKEVLLLKKIKKREDQKKIEYLEAQVAYLKAENDFLTNLPKKKRN